MSTFDTSKLWKIAWMESIIFYIQIIAGNNITTMMTILLLQSTSQGIALTTYLTRCDIKFSRLQCIGSHSNFNIFVFIQIHLSFFCT